MYICSCLYQLIERNHHNMFFTWHVFGNVIRTFKIGMNKTSFQAWNIDIWWCKIYRNIRFKLLLPLMAAKYFVCGQNWYCLFAQYPQNIWEKVCFYHFFIDPILCKDLNTSQQNCRNNYGIFKWFIFCDFATLVYDTLWILFMNLPLKL